MLFEEELRQDKTQKFGTTDGKLVLLKQLLPHKLYEIAVQNVLQDSAPFLMPFIKFCQRNLMVLVQEPLKESVKCNL